MQGSIPIQQVAIIIRKDENFRGVCQVYFSHTSCAVYIPQAKAWGFDRRALKRTIAAGQWTPPRCLEMTQQHIFCCWRANTV